MLAYREGNETYNIARIKADPEDKKIFIAVSGRETTRRVFLSLIRDTFAKIHNSFADLEVTEWVPVPDHPDHPPLDYQELLGLEAMVNATIPLANYKLGSTCASSLMAMSRLRSVSASNSRIMALILSTVRACTVSRSTFSSRTAMPVPVPSTSTVRAIMSRVIWCQATR
jgi:hypothetical protein